MGKGRNAAKGEKIHKYRFDDPNVCKFMLIDYCPHDLFVNTRHDLGPCDKIHDISLQHDYQKSSRYGKLGYEKDFEIFLKSLISDVDRRIKRGQERLRLTQTHSNADNLKNEIINKIKNLDEKITSHVLKSESLGNDCRIDEAQEVLNECEEMREEKKKLEMQLADEQINSDMNKPMEVCIVCGSFLIVGDIQSRLDEHNSGKQHAGYAKIRATLEELIQRKGSKSETEGIRHIQKQESSNRKRDRSNSKEKKSKRHHHHDHDDKKTKQRETSRERTDHHHHHRSSRHENNSSSKEHHSPTSNHRHHRR